MKTKKLGDLVEITIGRTPSRSNSDYWDKNKESENVWLSIADLLNVDGKIINNSKEYISDEAANNFANVPKGTLLVSFKLTLGRLAFAGRDLRTNEAIAALRNDESEVLNEYLYYCLSYFDWMSYAAADKKVKGFTLNKAKLHEINVHYPESLDEQLRIIAKLDAAFERIDKAERLTIQNIEEAKNLFQSALHVQQQCPLSLGDFVTIKTGKLDANAAEDGGVYPFFTCSRDIFAINTYAFDTEAILLAGNNASGDFNVKHYNGKFNAYQRTYVITINDTSRLIYRHLYFELTKALARFKAGSVGTGTKFLKIDMIKDLIISAPSSELQDESVHKLEGYLQKSEQIGRLQRSKLNKLRELKQSMLHDAFSESAVK